MIYSNRVWSCGYRAGHGDESVYARFGRCAPRPVARAAPVCGRAVLSPSPPQQPELHHAPASQEAIGGQHRGSPPPKHTPQRSLTSTTHTRHRCPNSFLRICPPRWSTFRHWPPSWCPMSCGPPRPSPVCLSYWRRCSPKLPKGIF